MKRTKLFIKWHNEKVIKVIKKMSIYDHNLVINTANIVVIKDEFSSNFSLINTSSKDSVLKR